MFSSPRSTVIRWIKGRHHGLYLKTGAKHNIADFGRKLEIHYVTCDDVGAYSCVTYVHSHGEKVPYEGNILPKSLSSEYRRDIKIASAHLVIQGKLNVMDQHSEVLLPH